MEKEIKNMNFIEFLGTLENDHPDSELSPEIRALWWIKKEIGKLLTKLHKMLAQSMETGYMLIFIGLKVILSMRPIGTLGQANQIAKPICQKNGSLWLSISLINEARF